MIEGNMLIATDFEGARIEVVSVDGRSARLAVPADQAAPKFRQHFAFDVVAEPGSDVALTIENAAACTWADAFAAPYRVYVSDGAAWTRAATRYARGELSVRHRMTGRRARFAYYPPYPSSRLARLRKAAKVGGGHIEKIAATPAGAPIEVLTFGARGQGKKRVWIIAQQHPGEAMAGWFVEGLVLALAAGRPMGKRLLERASVSIVPRMNPDGAAIGNHRTTPAGVDLNRVWGAESPPVEVLAVRRAMLQSGADLFIDVHGDERLPWVFVQAADAYPGRPPRIAKLESRFESAMMTATPDFQTKHKYPYAPPGKPNLAFASNWAQDRFGCLAMVLEMPFSNHMSRPDRRGFFPGRARRLGKSVLAGMLAAIEG
jgi:murein tripeptide amidase MpaA